MDFILCLSVGHETKNWKAELSEREADCYIDEASLLTALCGPLPGVRPQCFPPG